ncbi:MAG: hypothetical protein ACHQ51_11100 [Elusimicrobiota bacterium]
MLLGPETDGPYGAPRRFRRAWIVFILTLTLLPYFVNFWQTPKGFAYTWILPPYPADAYAYRAWSKQAFDGHWLFALKFTALPHRPFLFLPFFLAAGLLSRLTHLDIGLVHLLLKSVGVVVFFHAFFAFVRHLKLTPRQSIAAAAFAGISSGFGGFAPLLFPEGLSRAWTPVDVWLVDSNTFWSLLWNPLFPFSLALMLVAVRRADESLQEERPQRAWAAGAALTALAFLHPYPLAVLFPLLTGLCLTRRPKHWLPYWLRSVGAALPGALLIAGVSFFNPLIRTHNGLGTEETLSLFALIAGFGLPLLLVAAELFWEPDFFKKNRILFAWFAIPLALSYCPIWFRTKYLFGAHLPLCVLAGVAVERLLTRLPLPRAGKTAAAALLVALSSYSQIHNFRAGLEEVRTNEDGQYRIRDGMMAGLRYLDSRTDHSALVFAAAPTSAKICAFAGYTVMWGHWAQAVDAAERKIWIRSVFAEDSDLSLEERRRKFWDLGFEYLFLDGNWREGFGLGVGPLLMNDSDLVFSNPEVAIYRRTARAGRPLSNSDNQASSSPVSRGSPISRR